MDWINLLSQMKGHDIFHGVVRPKSTAIKTVQLNGECRAGRLVRAQEAEKRHDA